MYLSNFKAHLWGLVSASFILVNPLGQVDALPPPFLAQEFPPNSNQIENIPRFLVDAVRWDLSIRVGVHPDRFSFVTANRESWPDTCLGLSFPGEFCGQQVISGWRIVLSDGTGNWVYRTDTQGQLRRLASAPEEIAFPLFIGQMVLQAASEASQQPIESLEIENAIAQSWPDTCLGLEGSICSAIATSGWQITITSEPLGKTWDYRTNRDGSMILPVGDRRISTTSSQDSLPESVEQAVLKDLAHRRRLPLRTLEVIEATPETWTDSCLGTQLWNSNCEEGEIAGWRVVVQNQRRSWIYRSDAQGLVVYPERTQSSTN